jgi:hypothetical protein
MFQITGPRRRHGRRASKQSWRQLPRDKPIRTVAVEWEGGCSTPVSSCSADRWIVEAEGEDGAAGQLTPVLLALMMLRKMAQAGEI